MDNEKFDQGVEKTGCTRDQRTDAHKTDRKVRVKMHDWRTSMMSSEKPDPERGGQ